MKVGYVLPSVCFFSGRGNGIVAQAEYQAKYLRELGIEVEFIDPWKVDNAKPRAYDVVHVFLGGYGTYQIEKANPGVFRRLVYSPIIDSNQSNIAYRMAASIGNLFPERLNTRPGVIRSQAMSANAVVVRSSHEYRRVTHGLGVSGDKVELVLNGVVPPSMASEDVGLGDLSNVPSDFIFFAGAYTQERKNVQRLIEAVGPTGLPLVIGGRYQETSFSANVMHEASKYPNVRILGFLDSDVLWQCYRACRCFVLPSIHEGTGLVALEAAAMGANIVITKNGGPKDYFIYNTTFVDPFSVGAIREAIVHQYHASKNDRLKNHVVEQLSWRNTALRLEEVYSSVL